MKEMNELPEVVSSIGSSYNVEPKEVKVEIKKFPSAKSKECFDNSRKYVTSHRGTSYCLGYYLLYGQIPIEHAWVKEGEKFFDVTLKDNLENDEYYLFFEISREDLNEILLAIRQSPSIYDYKKYLRNKKA